MKPVLYSPDLETLEPNEAETARQLCSVLRSIMSITAADCGRGLRAVHAKSHGLLDGEFSIAEDLPSVLAQGLFGRARRYRALMRISTIPGDILDDQVSVPRGVALKVLDVPGSRLRGSEHDTVQDFILVDGPTFSTPSATCQDHRSRAMGENCALESLTASRARYRKRRQQERRDHPAWGPSADQPFE